MKLYNGVNLSFISAGLIAYFSGYEIVFANPDSSQNGHIKALAMIETGGSEYPLVGKHGEIGPYQIKANIVADFMSRDKDCKTYADVACRILVENTKYFKKHNRARTINNLDVYIMWNAGRQYYKNHYFNISLVSPVIRDRAIRFDNLCKAYYGQRN